MRFWGAMFVLLYGAGLLLRVAWPGVEPFGKTTILVALAGACVINFSCHRTLHCGITGPLFVVRAVAAGLIEAGAWHFDMLIVWAVVLLGVATAFVIDLRTVNRCYGRSPGRSGAQVDGLVASRAAFSGPQELPLSSSDARGLRRARQASCLS